MTTILKIAACAALACLFAPSAHGQQVTAEPYSQVAVAVTTGWDFGRGRFQDRWNTSLMPGVLVRTPAPLGDLELGIGVGRNWFDSGIEADFWSTRVETGWGHSVQVHEYAVLQATLHAGMYFMLFDRQPIGYARRESELMLGASFGVQVPVAGPLHVLVRSSYHRVFTSTPIDMVQVTGGLAWLLETPSWLRPMFR